MSPFLQTLLATLCVLGLAYLLFMRSRRDDGSQDEMAALREELTALRELRSAAESRFAAEQRTAERVPALEVELAALRRELSGLRAEAATLQETLGQERRQSAEKLALLVEAREAMTKEFKVLAEEVMGRHGEAFTKQNKEQVEGLLAPLREKLTEFQLGLQNSVTETAKERATLGQQIRQLAESSAVMTSETRNLTRALKGETQTQGAWGEMILATILERSGLREGEEYTTQESHTTEEGRRLRPDVIINLPGEGNQRVVVDSKVSLIAFEEYVNAETEADRLLALNRHLVSLRTHIRTLGGKNYQSALGTGLDYVIMFVPIEGALSAALTADPGLSSTAAEANVAIVTPTTLMIALRTIANVWKVERRNRNAEDIAVRAGLLYDKFHGFISDMEQLGSRLEGARQHYDSAFGKLHTGRGNVLTQIHQLKQLGARTNKSLPAELLSDEE